MAFVDEGVAAEALHAVAAEVPAPEQQRPLHVVLARARATGDVLGRHAHHAFEDVADAGVLGVVERIAEQEPRRVPVDVIRLGLVKLGYVVTHQALQGRKGLLHWTLIGGYPALFLPGVDLADRDVGLLGKPAVRSSGSCLVLEEIEGGLWVEVLGVRHPRIDSRLFVLTKKVTR
jgi:hypothetical protein